MSTDDRTLTMTVREVGQLRKWMLTARNGAIREGWFGSAERSNWDSLFRMIDSQWKLNRGAGAAARWRKS